MTQHKWLPVAVAGVLALGLAACGDDEQSSGGGGGGQELSGNIAIDGSSTVQPFAEAAAELFNEENPDVRITVGGSGTGDGFEKFCRGETQISNASRAIEKEEERACREGAVTPQEVQVANDGIAVVTNKSVTIDCLKVSELKRAWNQGSDASSFSEVKSGLGDTQISFFSPGEESGTFDFFTEEINGEEGVQRKGVQTSADDNTIVTGVSGDEGGFGYFGFSFYEENQDKVNAVAVDGGEGCVKPSPQTIQDGSYEPLARPLFMYPSKEALRRPEMKAFLDFVVANQQRIAEVSKIVPLTPEQAERARTAVG